MAEIRRGTAMLLLTAGDPEISGALADGIMAVRPWSRSRHEWSARRWTGRRWRSC